MTKTYGTLLGYPIEDIPLRKWQGIYQLMQRKGYETAHRMSLGKFLVDKKKGNEEVIALLDKYCPTEYHIKPIMSNADNIIFFVRKHIGGFARSNAKHQEFNSRINRGMKNGGYKLVGRYLEEMNYLPPQMPTAQIETLDITDDYRIHFVYDIAEVRFPTDYTVAHEMAYGAAGGVACNLGDIAIPMHHHSLQMEEANEPVVARYKDRIINRYDRQYRKGKEKYDTPLEDNVQPGYNERLDHIAEELMDGLQYAEWVRDMLDKHMNRSIEAVSKLAIVASVVPQPQREIILDVAREMNATIRELAGEMENVHESRREANNRGNR